MVHYWTGSNCVRQQAQEAVLAHQQELLSVLGGELAPPGHQLSRERLLGTDAEGFSTDSEPEADEEADEGSTLEDWLATFKPKLDLWGPPELPPHVQDQHLWTAATTMRKRLWHVISVLAKHVPPQR